FEESPDDVHEARAFRRSRQRATVARCSQKNDNDRDASCSRHLTYPYLTELSEGPPAAEKCREENDKDRNGSDSRHLKYLYLAKLEYASTARRRSGLLAHVGRKLFERLDDEVVDRIPFTLAEIETDRPDTLPEFVRPRHRCAAREDHKRH